MSNRYFGGKKWRGDIISMKILITGFSLNFPRACTLAFDRADQATGRGISKNRIFLVFRDFLNDSILPVKAH